MTTRVRLASRAALSYRMHAGTQPGNHALGEAIHQSISELFRAAEDQGLFLDPTSISLTVDRLHMVPAYDIHLVASGERQP